MKKKLLILNTIKFLKPIQMYYRLYYFVRRRVRKFYGFTYSLTLSSKSTLLDLQNFPVSYHYVNNKNFSFLNLSHMFEDYIDWNFSKFGKLWTYNLTYFDYLHQKTITKKGGLLLIYDFIEKSGEVKDGMEPFPISLRGINWIKFIVKHNIKDKKIDNSLYAQYYILVNNLEYHLLGNHLLENGFSLLFGAYYFEDKFLYKKAKTILMSELNEQILDDGAHFELSPMYHQLMLFRLLDCLNLVQNNQWGIDSGWLMEFLEKKAVLMLGWLKNISYKNGSIPLFNDSANKIAPTSKDLFEYAKRLSINHQPSTINHQPLTINHQPLTINQSGYRKIVKDGYECIVDVGNIGPDYIPGHAHADTFNFVLNINDMPFIIDTGISTYECGEIRNYERSTRAHNTVEVNNADSSEVWESFRVAKRAKIIKITEDNNSIKATHTGYSKFGVYHTRQWRFLNDKIIIIDTLNKCADAVFRLHFHPDMPLQEIKQKIVFDKYDELLFTNCYVAFEYNKRIKTNMLEVRFNKKLITEIKI